MVRAQIIFFKCPSKVGQGSTPLASLVVERQLDVSGKEQLTAHMGQGAPHLAPCLDSTRSSSGDLFCLYSSWTLHKAVGVAKPGYGEPSSLTDGNNTGEGIAATADPHLPPHQQTLQHRICIATESNQS